MAVVECTYIRSQTSAVHDLQETSEETFPWCMERAATAHGGNTTSAEQEDLSRRLNILVFETRTA
jgi:hypothetical protein